MILKVKALPNLRTNSIAASGYALYPSAMNLKFSESFVSPWKAIHMARMQGPTLRLYSTAIQSSIDGRPIVRPLGYHNISDEITNGINDEFYLGDNIIMVPVVTYGASERLVYLPKGKWINNWTKEEYDGKQFILVPCPLYQITGLPMFIKKRFHYSKTRFYINSLGKCTRHRTTPEVL